MPQHPVAPAELLLQVARDLIVKGWQPVWCLQRQSGGFSPMEGLTGYEAPFPTVVPQPQGAHRLGFRPPPSVVIIDVDHYDGKRGADTIDKAEEWLGNLPLTFKVTSRGLEDPSGRYLFRKPADLDFSDSALAQFGDDGHTHVEILRTGHRFSWAPGDINHKNGLTVTCFDPDGEPCLLPDVSELPELPPRWVEYLRNPPQVQSYGSYVRPGDGPQWWLLQADDSLASDTELSGFAFNLMMSRSLSMDEIFDQWLRVSHSDDPSWPWSREDFDRHTRAQAQNKVAQAIEREDEIRAGLPATDAQLDQISANTNAQYEREQKLVQIREQRIAETIQAQQFFNVQPLEEDTPQLQTQSPAEYLSSLVRGLPHYDSQYKNILARAQAEKDVAYLLSAQFTGYRSIAYLPEPPDPETLRVIGKDNNTSSVIARAKITVISGHRSSGKTWVTAVWAAQELRAGNTVIWIDFERQDELLASKLRQLKINASTIDQQLRYTSELPPSPQLVADVQAASGGGAHRVLVVVDAFRTLQNLVAPGTSANDGDAVEQVYVQYLTPLQQAGANLALLDHVAKTGLGTTFGSERKESAADYVIKVEKVAAFSRKTAGFSSLTLTKVRGGTEDEGEAAGYLWMPGDGTMGGESIREYPDIPTLRNWAPEAVMTLADVANTSDKARREEAVITIVADNRLQLGPRPLGVRAFEVYPELFTSAKSATDFARRMWSDGKLTKEVTKDGKYDLPVRVEVQSPAIRPEDLQHPEEQ